MFYFMKRVKIIVETFLNKRIEELLKICYIVTVSCLSNMHHKDRSGCKAKLKKITGNFQDRMSLTDFEILIRDL